MTEYIVIFVFLAWYILALVVSETIGKKRRIGVEWSFFLSIVLSPVLGYLITRFSPAK
jgi:hypothetical protein